MVTSEEGRKVPVVQAYAFGKYLGYLKVSFDDAGNVVKSTGNPILLDSRIKQGNEAESAIFVLRFLFFTRFLVPSLCCWRISGCSCHRVTGHMRDLWRLLWMFCLSSWNLNVPWESLWDLLSCTWCKLDKSDWLSHLDSHSLNVFCHFSATVLILNFMNSTKAPGTPSELHSCWC